MLIRGHRRLLQKLSLHQRKMLSSCCCITTVAWREASPACSWLSLGWLHISFAQPYQQQSRTNATQRLRANRAPRLGSSLAEFTRVLQSMFLSLLLKSSQVRRTVSISVIPPSAISEQCPLHDPLCNVARRLAPRRCTDVQLHSI